MTSSKHILELNKKDDKYAVIFTSKLNISAADYEFVANKMIDLVQNQKGFMGVESVRGSDGFGITISYWKSLEDIKQWKLNEEHLKAQKLGREKWYSYFSICICRIEREYRSENEGKK